jgi:C-terminal processing protease CtpA/Prc
MGVSFAQCSKEEDNKKVEYSNGDYYVGEFNDKGQRHGQGTYYWASGAKYEGQWENGSRTGQGKMTYDGGQIYEGTWKDDKRNGSGKYTFKDGSTFTCEWKDDSPADEKSYFLWNFKAWYFWKDEIGKIDAKDYSSAEDMLAGTKYAQDNISHIEDIATGSTTLFFEGKELGYGFGMRRDAANNLRVAYVHGNSPGGINGLKRGWRITHIDGSNVAAMANIPSNTTDRQGLTRNFTVVDENGNSKVISLTSSIYNAQTVLHNSVIQRNQKSVGYLALKSFISQTPDALLSAASSLAGSGISELVLDLRYCSGGSYSVLNNLVNIIAPNSINNTAYLKLSYNSDRAADNDTAYVIRKTGALNLSRIFVLTSPATINLSEYLICGLSPHINIIKIGDKTAGSGYGESYWTFGQKRHYAVTNKISNTLNESPLNGISPDYFAADGVDKPWGDESEPCLSMALFYMETGNFPSQGAEVVFSQTRSAIQIEQIGEPASPVLSEPLKENRSFDF